LALIYEAYDSNPCIIRKREFSENGKASNSRNALIMFSKPQPHNFYSLVYNLSNLPYTTKAYEVYT